MSDYVPTERPFYGLKQSDEYAFRSPAREIETPVRK
jgi:hypothetical protein